MSKTEILKQSISGANAKQQELLEYMKQQDQRLALIEQNQSRILNLLAQPAPQQPPQHVEATVTIPPEILVSLETASTLLSNASEQMPQQAKQVLSETINRDHLLTTQLYEVANKAANEMSVAATRTASSADEIKARVKEANESRMGLGTLLFVALIAGLISGFSAVELLRGGLLTEVTYQTIKIMKEQQNPPLSRSR